MIWSKAIIQVLQRIFTTFMNDIPFLLNFSWSRKWFLLFSVFLSMQNSTWNCSGSMCSIRLHFWFHKLGLITLTMLYKKLCVCMYIYIYIYIYIYMYCFCLLSSYTKFFTYINISVCICFACVCVCGCLYARVCTRTCVHACVLHYSQ